MVNYQNSLCLLVVNPNGDFVGIQCRCKILNLWWLVAFVIADDKIAMRVMRTENNKKRSGGITGKQCVTRRTGGVLLAEKNLLGELIIQIIGCKCCLFVVVIYESLLTFESSAVLLIATCSSHRTGVNIATFCPLDIIVRLGHERRTSHYCNSVSRLNMHYSHHYIMPSQHFPACLGADANEAAVVEIRTHDNDCSSWQRVVP